ncbi:MAG TPA: hypothetical protein VE650_07080 [Acetobacteraceae bacterium]|nr:hypothetical protein [Acetobacteraceae bacterium]
MRDKKVNILVQAALEKSPDLPNVPMLLDRVTDPKRNAALCMILSAQAMARPFATAPGVPSDRLEALREAFRKAVELPEFREEARKLGLEVKPVSSERIEQLIAQLYANPPEVVSIAKQAVGY